MKWMNIRYNHQWDGTPFSFADDDDDDDGDDAVDDWYEYPHEIQMFSKLL